MNSNDYGCIGYVPGNENISGYGPIWRTYLIIEYSGTFRHYLTLEGYSVTKNYEVWR